MSASAGPPAAVPSPPKSRFTRTDAALVGGGAVLTVLLAAAAARRPLPALGLLLVIAVVAAVLLARPRLARLRVSAVLAAGLIVLPAAALLGPSFALPSFPQLFLFRLVLAGIVAVGVTYLVVRREPLPFAAQDVALPMLLWFAWLLVAVVWSTDKAAAFNYLAIVVTMLALMLATAAAGGTRRRLVWLGYLLILAYLFIAGFSMLEARFGVRLPTSRLITAVTSQTYAVTSVFVNQNDLATYLAFCWPFMLCAFFFTRKARWLLLDLLLILIGGAAFVRTGSRSSLVAAGISTLAAVVLFWHLRERFSARTGKIAGAVVAVVIVVAGGYLLFNNSQSSMLRQFRLESLLAQAQAGKGSGDIRTSLTSRGFEIAGATFLVGAGPGQAEVIISSGTNALGISNLHDWWLETYADGGVVGFALHFVFFVMLVVALWPIARGDPDPYTRYLASGAVLALLGWTVGAVGPSSSVSFAPLWILYGLGLAVISRSRLAAAERKVPAPAAARAAVAAGTPQAEAGGEAAS
jgi:teichuronic acid biosynthesis protein TuaE